MLIPDVVDFNCKTNPSGPFYVYAKPDSSEIVTITHLEFSRACHRAANILCSSGGSSSGQVVAIIALSDTVLYHALLVGLITGNHIPFPISPRNSAAGVFQMLRTASCHRIIATCITLEPLLAELRQHIAEVDPNFVLTVEEVPSLSHIYPNIGVETPDCAFEPYQNESHATPDDICLYMHSSGSSGLPKTILQTHRAVMQWTTLPAVTEARDFLEKPFGNMALPCFHQFGIVCQLLEPLFGACAAVYPPTAVSPSTLPVFPTPDNVLDNARKTKCRTLTTVPALLSAWMRSPQSIAYLKTLDTVVWSGGPLPQRMGDALVDAGVNLLGVYGATEIGPLTSLVPREEDAKEWSWLRFTDAVDVRWVPQGDGTSECQVLTSEKFRPMVENLHDVKGYGTSDLFVNHPEKKHLWKIVGRVDDVIVHTSGEKTVPAPMEDIVASSPDVAGAVMFGSERAQAGIIIETVPGLQIDVQNVTQLAELRDKIWPTIEEANRIAPAFSRLFKETMLFTSRDKPLPRAGKGTVLRKATINLYSPEIEAIYETIEEQAGAVDSNKLPVVWEFALIQDWLIELATNLTNSTISPTIDLFQQGFDSLTATVFRLRVVHAIRSRKDAQAAKGIAQNLVYLYPTISRLSTYLEDLISGTATPAAADVEVQIEELIAKYSPTSRRPTTRGTTGIAQSAVVLLTGSTGNLGSQILVSLLTDDRVLKVYALNRPSEQSLAARHLDVFRERGLDTQLLASPKLVLIEGRTAQRDLGIHAELYEEIRKSVTLIIHNAWTLDFNKGLASFEPHISGTRHLIDLALSSEQDPKFIFTSSIASAQLWDPSRGPCPESLLNSASAALGGYGQSKYVAEQILAKSDLNASCLRIGQVCGALPKGAWATSDWVPILVKSGMTLGLLPVADGLVSWIDFDTVASAIMDVAFTGTEDLGRLPPVLNIVHPQPVSWNFVMECVRDALLKNSNTTPKDLKFVSFPEWYTELEACEARGGYDKEDLPGLKLLDFFSNLVNSTTGSANAEFVGPSFSVDKVQKISIALRDADILTKEHVEAWVDYWRAAGFV
ncbi:putative aminoadipate reductase [Mycena belliarum]|uniref:Aminoadipate reductase n=1 Tax=Mycena belliarum TaxID=1033014 RepID=A0AAD6TNQ4_9AGAR|nr:putative aminoadipate reductase [Mycena belliae]